FLWIKATVFGLVEAPAGSTSIRIRHVAEAERLGRSVLHERLRHVDPLSAERLHPNDFVRVSRALEVFELTGQRLSEIQGNHRFASPHYPATFYALSRSANDLTDRIRHRVHAWLSAGWIEEVQELRERGWRNARAMGSVGYKEINALLDGHIP